MVRAKVSEYRHAYRGADNTVRDEYLGHTDYVQKRRLLESLHIQSPFEWDAPDDDDFHDSGRYTASDKEISKLASELEQKVQLVPDKCSPGSQRPAIRKVVSLQGKKSKAVQVDSSLSMHSKSTSPSPPRPKSAAPLGNTSASSYFRSYRPFVDNLPRVRRAPETATTASKCSQIHVRGTPEEEMMLDGALRPPEFSPYAVGNKARRISGKRTPNVRADAGVFSTALRASANRTAAQAYDPPSSAPYGSPEEAKSRRRHVSCSYHDCRCSKNYSF